MKTNCMSQMKPNLQKALRTHYLDNTEAKRMINATMNIMVRQLICHTVVTAVRPVMLRIKGDLLRKRNIPIQGHTQQQQLPGQMTVLSD